MALSVTRGTTRTLVICLEGCTEDDYIWTNYDKTIVRIVQGSVVIDKELEVLKDDATAGVVFYTQEDTLRLNDSSKAKLQISSIKETKNHQASLKSPIFDVIVCPSLWNDEITTGVFEEENFDLIKPEYPDPMGHVAYDYLHIDIREFAGVISEKEEAVLEGLTLVVDGDTETLYSETE